MADDFEEYEALEAEAESLAENAQAPAAQQGQRPANPAANQAQTRPANPAQAPMQVTPARRPANPARTARPSLERPTNVPAPQKIPRYIAIHQPERIAIIDTQTEDVIAEGFKDDGVAMAMAKLMNDQDTIIVGAGYQ